jgi:hypothetical protein
VAAAVDRVMVGRETTWLHGPSLLLGIEVTDKEFSVVRPYTHSVILWYNLEYW